MATASMTLSEPVYHLSNLDALSTASALEPDHGPALPPSHQDQLVNPGEIGDHDRIWVVRTTGEMYRTYGEYINRVAELRRPVYECPLSGRTGLRYEETLSGSRLVEERLSSFPSELTRPFLDHVHHSTAKLNDLINSVYKVLDGAVSKQLIKLKIKQTTQRAPNSKAPWIVHPDLFKEYSIEDKPLSEEAQEILEAWRSGKPIRRRGGAGPPHAIAEDSAANEKAIVEDTEISGYDQSQPPAICRAPEWTIDVNFDTFRDVYMGWHFIHRFHRDIAISRFSFHEWLEAVNHPDSSKIYSEVVDSLMHLLRFGKPATGPSAPIEIEQIIKIISPVHEEMEELTGTGLRYMNEILALDSIEQFISAGPKIRAFIVRQLCDQALSSEHIRAVIDNDVVVRQELKQSQKNQLNDERKDLKKQKALIKQEKANLAQSKAINLVENVRQSFTSDVDVDGNPKSRQKIIAEQKQLKAAEAEQRAAELEQQKAESRIKMLEQKYEAILKDAGRSTQCLSTIKMLKLQVRGTPLGLDRFHNEYYWSPESQGLIIVTRPSEGIWGWYESPKQIAGVCEFLSEKGVRESAFLEKLKILRQHIVDELEAEAADTKNLGSEDSRSAKRKTRANRESDEGAWTNKFRRMSQ